MSIVLAETVEPVLQSHIFVCDVRTNYVLGVDLICNKNYSIGSILYYLLLVMTVVL